GAQTVSPEDVAAARSLGTDGTRLADAGDCNGAIPKLEAAEKLFHAPTTLDRLGECEISVGRLVAGTEDLNRVVREPLAASAPPAFLAAKKRAQAALTAALPRIGNLKIHVDGPTADKIAITVDGVAVSSALLDADRPTDPGAHAVSVSATGYKADTENVNVREGAKSTLDSECANKTCPAKAQSDIDSLSSKATISTVGFGVGIAGVAVGAILLVVQHGSEKSAATWHEVPRPVWSPWIGVGTAGVGGTFQ